jgi:hypothetical protein
MLREADRRGIDVEDPKSDLCLEAFEESVGMNNSYDVDEPRSERDALQQELEKDADAIARILNSPHTPEEIRDNLANRFLEFTEAENFTPEVTEAKYLAAMMSDKKQDKDAPEKTL